MLQNGEASARCKLACAYHERGFNCAQSVVAAFSDLIGLDEQRCLDVSAGFGHGAATEELCGAISGGIIVLNLLTPVDMADPQGSKKRSMGKAKELQRRFAEKFGAVRCDELMPRPVAADDTVPAAKALGITNHCRIRIITTVEILEEMLAEQA